MKSALKNLWTRVFKASVILVAYYQLNAPAYSQKLVIIHEWEAEDVVDANSDISGHLYLSDKKGVITKYSPGGDLLATYSGDNPSPISSIDVSHSSKIFGLYRDSQTYILLDKFLNPLNQARINSMLIGYATESGYSADNNLWVFDQSDLTIKKVNLIHNVLITTLSLTLIVNDMEWDIQQVEEYQNRIYILNSTGEIYTFDNLGNYIGKMDVHTDSYFGFFGEYMYYVEDSGIFSYHLYRQESYQLGRLDDATNFLKVISTNDFMYLIFRNRIIKLKHNNSSISK